MEQSNERWLTSPAIYFCFERMTSYTSSFLPSSLIWLSNTAMSAVNPLALKTFRVNQGCRGRWVLEDTYGLKTFSTTALVAWGSKWLSSTEAACSKRAFSFNPVGMSFGP